MINILSKSKAKEYQKELIKFNKNVEIINAAYSKTEVTLIPFSSFDQFHKGDNVIIKGFEGIVIDRTEREICIELTCKKNVGVLPHYHDFLELIHDQDECLIVSGNVEKRYIKGSGVMYIIRENEIHAVQSKKKGKIKVYLKNTKFNEEEI